MQATLFLGWFFVLRKTGRELLAEFLTQLHEWEKLDVLAEDFQIRHHPQWWLAITDFSCEMHISDRLPLCAVKADPANKVAFGASIRAFSRGKNCNSAGVSITHPTT